MASIFINEAEVSRSFWNGKGLEVVERFSKNDGTQGEKKYSAFFDNPHGLEPGTKVKLSGLLGWKSRTFESQQGETLAATDITVNNPKVEILGAPSGSDEETPW